MRRVYFTLAFALVALVASAAAPNGSGTYYQNANGKKGAALKTALRDIVQTKTELGYDALWTVFKTSDVRSDGMIWDMYSNITSYVPGGPKQGADYSGEGDSYNREHSFPKSWFGGEIKPMYTDLHHMYPTDGFVNNKRANYPFGEVSNPTYSSAGGFSKLGPCSYSGYSGTVFEPADEYKGDFARTYFYMVTRYEEKLPDWYSKYSDSRATLDGSTYPGFQIWQLNMLLAWAAADPVSPKEINRNNVVKSNQGNRNPFIDYPGLEQYIWGSKTDVAFSYNNYVQPTEYTGYTGSGGQGGETGEDGVDVIDLAFTGVPAATNYVEWSGKSGSSSSAVYAGNNAGGNNSIQLRSNSSNSGIVSTSSGGTVTKVKVTWNSNTESGRTLDIYGKNTAYSSATNLYDSSTQGTKLGSIVYGTSTELTITDSYAYIGLRSNNGAMYLDKIEITWDDGSTPPLTSDLALTGAPVALSFDLYNNSNAQTVSFTTSSTGAVTVSASEYVTTSVSGNTITVTPVKVTPSAQTITVSQAADDTYEAGEVTFTVTVTDGTPTPVSEGGYFTKVMSMAGFEVGGTYLIVYEGGSKALNGALEAPDVVGNGISVTISNDRIEASSSNMAATFIITEKAGGYSIRGTSGKYIGNNSSDNALKCSYSDLYTNSLQFDVSGNVYIKCVKDNNISYLRFNKAASENRFRYFKSGSYTQQQAIQLYKLVEPVTVTSVGYATYCSEYALNFEGTGITAYVGTLEGTALTFTPITQVPANTGLLLVAEGGKTADVPVIASAPALSETNCLTGVNVATTLTANDYILNVVSGRAGFYKAGEFTALGAHKAYIPAVAGGNVKSFAICLEDDPTSIQTIDNRQRTTDDAIYNLAGQRIQKLQKGINIVNGKKILK